MPNPVKYFDRDISWLSFNHRVLQEAADITVPLYERIKFLAIYSSNLDEFFRVRVGTIRSLLDIPGEAARAQQLLDEIYAIVSEQQNEFGSIFRKQIIPALKKQHILLVRNEEYTAAQRQYLRNYFQDEVVYQLQPILLVKNKVAPFLQNGAIYFVVCLLTKPKKSESPKKRRIKYSIVKIPSDTLPRFIEMPRADGMNCITFLDDVIRDNLEQVFRGYEIDSVYSIKLSRDADLHIEDDYKGNMVEKLKKNLSKRKTGVPARFLYDESMPAGVLDFLKSAFNLKKNDLVPGARYHNFFDFFKFPNPLSPSLEAYIPVPMRIPEFDSFPSMFEAIKTRDWLLHFPYQSYDYVVRFLHEASFDPKVVEIKATQYRVAPDSAIVNALIAAARNGKSVTVFVEIKARFDEEVNIRFAQQMEAAGIRIIYSPQKIKVHGKACMVSRKSGNRYGLRHYAFLSTGNFNEKTAKVYSDQGFFTANPEITDELKLFFSHLETQKKNVDFKKLLIAKFNMIVQFRAMIEREIAAAKNGEKAYILVKVNNLEDEDMIDLLYKASEAGVKIDVIVRSVCRLIPGKPFSRNIVVRRIVDMFLEHARVFVFHNGGKMDVILSSADWMKRNLSHRIELGFPLEDLSLKNEMLDILDLQLRDNLKSRIVDQQLRNLPIDNDAPKLRAQSAIYEYLRDKYFRIFNDD